MPAAFLPERSPVRTLIDAVRPRRSDATEPGITHAALGDRVVDDPHGLPQPGLLSRLLRLLPCGDCFGGRANVEADNNEERDPLVPKNDVPIVPSKDVPDDPQRETSIAHLLEHAAESSRTGGGASMRRSSSDDNPAKKTVTSSSSESSLQIPKRLSSEEKALISADLRFGGAPERGEPQGILLLNWRLNAGGSAADIRQLDADAFAETPLGKALDKRFDLRGFFNREFRMGQVRFGSANAMVDGKLLLDPNDPQAAIETIKCAKDSAHFSASDVKVLMRPGTDEPIKGSEKTLHGVTGNHAVVIALSGRNVSPAKLEKEIADLNKLQDVGLPVVRHYGLVFVGSERGILMDFIADARSSTITTGTRNMNQNTIDDLMMIKRILRERNIHIKDFQFLIATDGHVYIIDPQGVGNGVQQSNISLIDTMLALAREAVPS